VHHSLELAEDVCIDPIGKRWASTQRSLSVGAEGVRARIDR